MLPPLPPTLPAERVVAVVVVFRRQTTSVVLHLLLRAIEHWRNVTLSCETAYAWLAKIYLAV